jgi:hypothetical protein
MFEDREKAAERQFEREQELAFRIAARRNRLIGLWAAGRMGLVGDAADAYARALVEAAVGEHAEGALVKKICEGFLARGYIMSELEVSHRLAGFATAARRQLLESGAGNGDPHVM